MLYILFDVAFSLSLFHILLRINGRFRVFFFIHGALLTQFMFIETSPRIYRQIQNYIRQKSSKISMKIALESENDIIGVYKDTNKLTLI